MSVCRARARPAYKPQTFLPQSGAGTPPALRPGRLLVQSAPVDRTLRHPQFSGSVVIKRSCPPAPSPALRCVPDPSSRPPRSPSPRLRPTGSHAALFEDVIKASPAVRGDQAHRANGAPLLRLR
ncbi:hypothetical protein SKAU_G00162900 [Synaphobranchus kaupii]|uniref:Uncharacterized protein n=1 Tax=Synaphobranchus kaupii TaxID=118154 RepID=A0A9Q1FJG0_SYNKA|nr:hypothetical protein SKAU_G00162900 [Synaphobranchus kaupii]